MSQIGGIDWLTRLNRLEARNIVMDDTNGGVAGAAITIVQGLLTIIKGSAAAYTLRAPVAGLPQNGGEDGNTLRINTSTAFAHTVTCPSNVLNGNKAIATFAAAVGNGITLTAKNGVWLVTQNAGITLT